MTIFEKFPPPPGVTRIWFQIPPGMSDRNARRYAQKLRRNVERDLAALDMRVVATRIIAEESAGGGE